MKKRKYKNLLIILCFFVCNVAFSSSVNNYVDKKDKDRMGKIFIYREDIEKEKLKKLQTELQNLKNKESKDSQNNQSNQNNKNQKKSSSTNQKNGEISKSENNSVQKTVIEKVVTPVVTKKIKEIYLDYGDAKEISEALDGFEDFKMIGIDNKIILNGDEKKFLELERIIKSLDRAKEQVIIKGTIIDTSSNLFERLGIDWSINPENANPNRKNLIGKFLNGEVSISSIFSMGGNFLGIDFNLLKENGDIKIEAMPTLMIMEKEEGELRVTEEVIIGEKKITKNNEDYVEPIFSEAGIVFKILPEIKNVNGEKKIILKMDTEISNFKLTSSYNESSGAKQKNQTRTTITLNNGGSTFIGGLKQNVGKETVRKIPILSSIPIIGPLFKYQRKNKEMRDIYIEIEAIIQEIK
ncbi:type II secretion system protein GspD [Leptotrichia sp. oral taxon 221]|uniref:type II secretion system protein GspD n=1 Tax=Leptotrichia sp. oral taxon 221 TaxID=712362 RepID=UPI001B8C0598|nr:general secretion pathway protein GspD [Leptotrichia sp. oral taxon 221]QUB96824.1 general secretion pathway protein GspD [Leptotrichia sp. oral taxon 221]